VYQIKERRSIIQNRRKETAMSQDEIKVKSLYKSLKILECFTKNTPELGVTEISNMLQLYKSNVHNMLSTLEVAGYVEKNPRNSKYHLSNKMLEFSYVVTSRFNYQNVVYQVMKRVSDELGEMMYFGVPHGAYVLYMFTAYPTSYDKDYPFRSIMGEKAPLYCTSVGKAMLMAMDEEEIVQRIDMERKSYTPNTLTEEEAILEDIREARERGYAIDNIEHERNVKCIGVPIFGSNDELIGGLSISSTAHDFDDDKLVRCANVLRDAAYEIRRKL